VNIIVIKLGSALLADDRGTLRDLSVRVGEICALRGEGIHPVLVSSGAVACGTASLGIDRPADLVDLQAVAAVGQGVLIARYREWCAPHGVIPAQVLLTAEDLERTASRGNARATLQQLLQWGVLPVINENDTTATAELTFGDNDLLAAGVADLLDVRLLILLGEQEGIIDPSGGVIPVVSDPGSVAIAELPGSGRGGMASKLEALARSRAAGIDAVVASGIADGVIPAVVRGGAVGSWCRSTPLH